VQLKVGQDALRLLKTQPLSGSSFIPRILGRLNSSLFQVPQILNASELLSFLISDFFSTPQFSDLQASVVVIPAYFTSSQRQDIIYGMWGAHVNYAGMIDDVHAISYFYSIRFSKKFSKQPISVLFVDIGAVSAKAYRIHFGINHTLTFPLPFANMTSYEFTENSGGELMAIEVSKRLNISIKKSRQLLYSDDFDQLELISEQLSELNSMVRRAINDEIDVVQVFGGASRLSFVIETIQNAIGENIEIKRELPVTDALAIGGAYALAEMQNLTVFDFPNLKRRSPYNIYVECGDSVDDYCQKNRECEEGSLFDIAWCEKVEFKTSLNAVPVGTNELLGKYKLLNMSVFNRKSQASGGFLLYKTPFPVLSGVMWCKIKNMDCDQIAIQEVGMSLIRAGKVRSFVQAVLRGQKEQQKVNAVKERINDIIEKIQAFLETKGGKLEEEEKMEVEEVVKVAKEEVKYLTGMVQLEIVEESLESQANALKINL
jgi:molecular chaperone DnaK (HSP70)